MAFGPSWTRISLLMSEGNTECIAQKGQSALWVSAIAGKISEVDKKQLSIDSLTVQIGQSLRYIKDKITPHIQLFSIPSTSPLRSSTLFPDEATWAVQAQQR